MQNIHVTWLFIVLGPGISGSSSQMKIRDAGEICFYWHASQDEMTGDYFSLVIRNLARYSYNAFTHKYSCCCFCYPLHSTSNKEHMSQNLITDSMLVTTNEDTPTTCTLMCLYVTIITQWHVTLNCTTTDAPYYACAGDSSEHPCDQMLGYKHHSYMDALQDGCVDHFHACADVSSEH